MRRARGTGLRGTGLSVRVRAGAPLLLACTLASFALLVVSQAPAAALVLPDGRAWEMVSPPEKNNSLITGIDGNPGPTLGGVLQAATNGEALIYASNGAFEEPAASPLSAQYLATRSASAWSTVNITPTIGSESYNITGAGGPYKAFSSDLSSGLLLNGGKPTPIESPPPPNTNGPEGYQNYYVHELDAGIDGGFQAVLTSTPSEPASAFGLEFQGATSDLAHIVFSTDEALTPNAVANGFRNLYEWSDGQLQLVNILPEREQGTPNAVLGENHNGDPGGGLHAISDDGSVVFFTDEQNLYARVSNTSAVQVDMSREEGLESGGGLFQTASSDGSRVFFTDDRRLTSDSTTERGGSSDLYEYDLKSGQLSDLTVADPLGAGVQRVLGASEDGSYVYFVANGVLAEGAPPRGACCNLYVWHRSTPTDTITHIATLSEDDNREAIESRPENKEEPDDWAPEIANRTSRVAPDGQHLVFMSDGSLTGYDNRNAETGQPVQEVYDYNAGTGILSCASCNPSGARPRGGSNIPAGTQFEGKSAIYQSRVLSDLEGRARVFFDSSDALIPRDTNGEQDVYEWEEGGRGNCHDARGCVGLISSGTGSGESSFVDASASGNDVFFLTGAELVPQDTDQLLDLYDAREGGGFPIPPAATPPCEGEACAAPPSQAPASGAPLSASYTGVSNPPPRGSKPAARPKHRSKPKKKHGRKAKRGAKKTSHSQGKRR
jgi:hypothetical protein